MAYPYPDRTSRANGETLVYAGTFGNSTADSGVSTHTFDFPPGAYTIGGSIYEVEADQNTTVKFHAYVDPDQSALSGALRIMPHDSATVVTALSIAANTNTGGDTFHFNAYTAAGGTADYVVPYGLQMTVTCNTNSGYTGYKIIAQKRG